MAQPATQILGRETELASLGDFVTAAREDPVALLIDGDPGVGKTTIWQAGVEEARGQGFRVLACRPVESESKLAPRSS